MKHVENIALPVLIYAITVEHHHFCITSSDIVVHNSDTASLGSIAAIATIASLTNPISGIIGGTVVAAAAISIILYQILHNDSPLKHEHNKAYPITPTNSTTPSQNPIALQEQVHNAQKIEAQKAEDKQSEHGEKSAESNGGDPEPEPPTDQEDDNGNDDKNNDKNKSKKVEIGKDDESHIFEDRPGHMIDTPENRNLLIALASNVKNFLGLDKHGTEWYAQITANGKQLWAAVRNCIIRNGGINDVPKIFNSETGLCQLPKMRK